MQQYLRFPISDKVDFSINLTISQFDVVIIRLGVVVRICILHHQFF